MTKSELIQRLAERNPHLYLRDIEKIVETVFDEITWRSIAGDLPERGTVHTFAEDHINPNLLFIGTEFGAHFTLDAGQHWFKVPGHPTPFPAITKKLITPAIGKLQI